MHVSIKIANKYKKKKRKAWIGGSDSVIYVYLWLRDAHTHTIFVRFFLKVSEALVDYKNAGGGVFGGSGVGDLFFLGAAPAVVALGFSLYEQV